MIVYLLFVYLTTVLSAEIIQDVFFNKFDAFTALRLNATGAQPAAKLTRILPMTQHADNILNEGKFLPLFTDR
jgi:hypothetical protein